jgi:hypothetical protein
MDMFEMKWEEIKRDPDLLHDFLLRQFMNRGDFAKLVYGFEWDAQGLVLGEILQTAVIDPTEAGVIAKRYANEIAYHAAAHFVEHGESGHTKYLNPYL